jgi:electron transfer flavoprotein alpha subunit
MNGERSDIDACGRSGEADTQGRGSATDRRPSQTRGCVVRGEYALRSAQRAGAIVVIGVGLDIQPQDYFHLEPLRWLLGAIMTATRKVTDQGWMLRSRQVRITGLSSSSRLLVSTGAAGRFNHMVCLAGVEHVLALN